MIDRYAGRWTLTRTIADVSTGVSHVCSGEATLTPDGDWLRYDEAVALWLAERPLRATRRYYYRADGRLIVATFSGREPFFTASVDRDGTVTARHHCGPDLYTGTYRFADARWFTQWEIRGTKALRITTDYHRAPAADS